MNQGLGVGQESPIRNLAAAVTTGAGATAMGSTDTAVIRYTAAMMTVGAGAFTVTEAAATGTILTCQRGGLWHIQMSAALAGAGNLQIAIGINAAAAGAITTTPIDFAVNDAAAGTMGVQALAGDTNIAADGPHLLNCQCMLVLAPSDTVRFYATAAVTLDANNTRVRLTPLYLN